MQIIRESQLATLRQGLIDSYLDELAAHLHFNFAEPAAQVGDRAALRKFAQQARATSARYGIETRGGVAIMAELMLQFGENLQWSPLREWTFNILETPRLPGQLKIETIRDKYFALTGGRIVLRPQI